MEATRFSSLSPYLALASQCSTSSWNPRLWGIVVWLGVVGRLGIGGVNTPSDGKWVSKDPLTVVKVGRSGSQSCPVLGVLVNPTVDGVGCVGEGGGVW